MDLGSKLRGQASSVWSLVNPVSSTFPFTWCPWPRPLVSVSPGSVFGFLLLVRVVWGGVENDLLWAFGGHLGYPPSL